MCDAVSSEGYEEELQRGMIKPASFYAEEGAKLRWFYWIDSNGRLYIEDVMPKNIATSLKSPKFLEYVAASVAAHRRLRGPQGRTRPATALLCNLFPQFRGCYAIVTAAAHASARSFFFRQLRPNNTGMHEEYPYVSPCGKEMNFIRCADRPIVFHTLVDGELEWAASRREPFNPDDLAVCPETGRMYHPCRSHKSMAQEPALLHAHLAAKLAENLEEVDDGDALLLHWDGRQARVPFLHSSAAAVQ